MRQIRQSAEIVDVPVIFVSALAYAEQRLAGYEAGSDAYITKPYVGEESLAKVSLTLSLAEEKKLLRSASASSCRWR